MPLDNPSPPVESNTWRDGLRTLRSWPWRDTLNTVGQRFREDRLSLTAGSLTFTTVISLVPMMTTMLALFTAFPVFARFKGALEQYFLKALVPDDIARPVLAALNQFAAKASQLGAVGLVFTLAAALALVFTIDRTLNALWRVQRPRPLAQRVLVYWAAITLGPLLLGASLTLTSYAVSASRGMVTALPGGVGLLFELLEFVLLTGCAALLFKFVPHTHVRWTHALAGALVVAAGLELAKAGLAWYLKVVPAYSTIYGAFATVPILLLWIFLGWLILLMGAVVAAYAPSLALQVRRLPDAPGLRFAVAMAVLRALVAAARAGRGGLSVTQLASAAAVDPLQVEPIVDQLAALDWVGRLDEDGQPRIVLLVPPDTTTVAQLVDRLLLAAGSPGVAVWRDRVGLDRQTLAQLVED
ncbi:MAG: YihY family inner membrane protein [Aquabacterium sp.]